MGTGHKKYVFDVGCTNPKRSASRSAPVKAPLYNGRCWKYMYTFYSTFEVFSEEIVFVSEADCSNKSHICFKLSRASCSLHFE